MIILLVQSSIHRHFFLNINDVFAAKQWWHETKLQTFYLFPLEKSSLYLWCRELKRGGVLSSATCSKRRTSAFYLWYKNRGRVGVAPTSAGLPPLHLDPTPTRNLTFIQH